MLVVAGRVEEGGCHLAAKLEHGLRTQSGQTADGGSDARKAADDSIHPREGVYDHKVDKAAAQNLFDHAPEEVGGVDLALSHVLDPGNDDVDEKQCEEELERVRLNCCAVF